MTTVCICQCVDGVDPSLGRLALAWRVNPTRKHRGTLMLYEFARLARIVKDNLPHNITSLATINPIF